LIVAQSLGPLVAGALKDRFHPRRVWYGCSIICAVSMISFYSPHLHARKRLNEKQNAQG
jgi:hypothetical protein